MGKVTRARRIGKGRYKAPSFRFKAITSYRSYDEQEKKDIVNGKVVDIINDPSRTSPLIVVQFDSKKYHLPAFEGAIVGHTLEAGVKAEIKPGNIIPLAKIPDGTVIYNIELQPGDGGKIVRAAGTSARVVIHEKDKVVIRFPSKKFKTISGLCRATVGVVAGTGRREKPIVKAGKKFYIMKARGKMWPVTAGVAMNVVDHRFGGKRRSTLKSVKKTVSRRAPPGRKVGSIAAKRTGKRRRK